MRSEQDSFIGFLQCLVEHPDKVQVTQADADPIIYEVRVCKEDLAYLLKVQKAIQTIARSEGLGEGQAILRLEADS